ncbi:hypothetical protein AK812_SmicGene2740 [Symbiodinium microadriaticum]|uniref:Uncharacterized protein n=1 Tax=Symbiodinium microadriaticum TaxID=2951 RepID=A0A1Q9F0R6_SYMMI|nr:hypothetical protein AK812_SmicGene2740 [Symbiodinium microadriaticum]CAE7700851.1 unnamed protein product [Symbiodinium microadriaticum]CAE7948264.1 unnamed protein product [Symbiodinium sp. KB8]
MEACFLWWVWMVTATVRTPLADESSVPECIQAHWADPAFRDEGAAALPHWHYNNMVQSKHQNNVCFFSHSWDAQEECWDACFQGLAAIVRAGGLANFQKQRRCAWQFVQDLVRRWLSSRGDELVWSALHRGSQLARLYTEVTMPHLQNVLGSLWTPADNYCTTAEAKFQVSRGLLAAHPAFDHLRRMMTEASMLELAIGQPRAGAGGRLPGATECFEALLLPTLFRQGINHIRLHACSLPVFLLRRSLLRCTEFDFAGIDTYKIWQGILRCLTGASEPLYAADAAASLWVMSKIFGPAVLLRAEQQ